MNKYKKVLALRQLAHQCKGDGRTLLSGLTSPITFVPLIEIPYPRLSTDKLCHALDMAHLTCPSTCASKNYFKGNLSSIYERGWFKWATPFPMQLSKMYIKYIFWCTQKWTFMVKNVQRWTKLWTDHLTSYFFVFSLCLSLYEGTLYALSYNLKCYSLSTGFQIQGPKLSNFPELVHLCWWGVCRIVWWKGCYRTFVPSWGCIAAAPVQESWL